MAFDMSKLVSPEFQAMMHREAKENKQVSGKGQAGLTESTASVASMSADDSGDARFDAAMQARMAQLGQMSSSQGALTEEQMMQAKGIIPQASTSNPLNTNVLEYHENANSKLPPAILATLKKNQGLAEQAAILQGQTSGIGQLAGMVKKQQPIVEQKVTAPKASLSNGFDYTILKGIIKECLDEKFKEYAQQSLNESALRTVQLKGGKIRLVDNSGNIYAAKLERMGNIKDNK